MIDKIVFYFKKIYRTILPVKAYKPKIPGNIKWPLFDRMAVYADKNKKVIEKHKCLIGNSSNYDLPVYEMNREEFTSENLINMVNKLSEEGGILNLPAGRVELSEELKIGSYMTIIGVEDATEIVFKDTDYGIVIKGNASEITHVKLKNLRIRHMGEHRFCAAILVTKARRLQFSNIEIISPLAVGFLFSDGVHQSNLNHCLVYEAGLAGFMMVRDVSEVTLDSCIAEKCQQSGIFLTDMKLPTGMDPLDFNAQIYHTNEVIGNFGPFHPDDPSPCNNTFINCKFSHNRKMGITTDGVGFLRVINSIISHNDCEGITIDNGSWGCQILNCTIHGNGWRGMQHDIELSLDFVNELGIMEDGSSMAKLPGISLDNAAYSRIENNCIEGNFGDGIKFVRSVYSCTVSGNIISNNNRGINNKFHFFGTLVGVAERQHKDQCDFPSCFNSIFNNDITGNHYAGIHLAFGTSGNMVKNNTIVGEMFHTIENCALKNNIIS